MVFLTSNLNLPVWVPLLLFISSLPVIIKLLRWFKKPKATKAKITQNSHHKQAPASKTPKTHTQGVNDSVFSNSIILAAHKLKAIKEPVITTLTDSIATTADKLKTIIDNKEKSLGPATVPTAAITQRVSEKTQSENEKETIIKALYASSDGKLSQSLADDLNMSTALLTGYLSDLIQKKLVEKRRTMIGETFSLTSLGKAYCLEKGHVAN